MNNLIIDAAGEKILFIIITNNKSYTKAHSNSRENFDKLVILLFDFLKENNLQIKDLSNIFVHQGPGKFSSIRSSIAVAKGICVANNLNLYGFNGDQVESNNYSKVVYLFEKGELKKNLIKPQYLS